MTAEHESLSAPGAKLRFLAEVVLLEAEHLLATDARLFALPMAVERAASIKTDIDLSERTDAFVARFGRLQDTLADRLLPALLQWLAEPPGAAIDNLNRAERLGWIASVETWLEARRLRNRMVHEYVKKPSELASSLNTAHAAVPALNQAALAMTAHVAAGAVNSGRTARPERQMVPAWHTGPFHEAGPPRAKVAQGAVTSLVARLGHTAGEHATQPFHVGQRVGTRARRTTPGTALHIPLAQRPVRRARDVQVVDSPSTCNPVFAAP